jgi:broad-specificity NMP kinase
MHRKVLPPDYIFILTCPVAIAAERMRQRDVKERYDSNGLQERYAQRYRDFSRPSYRMVKSSGIPALEGSGSKIIPTVGKEKVFHIDTEKRGPEAVIEEIIRLTGLL